MHSRMMDHGYLLFTVTLIAVLSAWADVSLAVESSEARENRTRTRRVVPDFPVVEPVERIVAPVRGS